MCIGKGVDPTAVRAVVGPRDATLGRIVSDTPMARSYNAVVGGELFEKQVALRPRELFAVGRVPFRASDTLEVVRKHCRKGEGGEERKTHLSLGNSQR